MKRKQTPQAAHPAVARHEEQLRLPLSELGAIPQDGAGLFGLKKWQDPAPFTKARFSSPLYQQCAGSDSWRCF